MNHISARGDFGKGPAGAGDTAPAPLQLYEQALSLVPMGAFSCDLATSRLTWTAGVFDIFGLSGEDAPARQSIVELYSEESRENLERKRSRAIATRSGFSLDASITRADGTDRRIRITAAVSHCNGRAVSLYGTKQDITDDHMRWEFLRQQAECDPLTGVANRARFQHFLEQQAGAPALEDGSALVLFDLDGFKQVNDRWGHMAGDACLTAFGNRLKKTFPQASLISRIGGDEFAMLLPPSSSTDKIRVMLGSAVASMLSPVAWSGDMLPLGVSVGLAFASAETGLRPQDLFVAADRALYDSKNGGAVRLVGA